MKSTPSIRAADHLARLAVALRRNRACIDYVNAALLGEAADNESVLLELLGYGLTLILVHFTAERHNSDPSVHIVRFYLKHPKIIKNIL